MITKVLTIEEETVRCFVCKLTFRLDDEATGYKHDFTFSAYSDKPSGSKAEALSAANNIAARFVKDINEAFSDPFKRLAWFVKNYDWYYEMSDSHRVWVSGQVFHVVTMQAYELAKAEDPQKALEVWNKNCHADFVKEKP